MQRREIGAGPFKLLLASRRKVQREMKKGAFSVYRRTFQNVCKIQSEIKCLRNGIWFTVEHATVWSQLGYKGSLVLIQPMWMDS